MAISFEYVKAAVASVHNAYNKLGSFMSHIHTFSKALAQLHGEEGFAGEGCFNIQAYIFEALALATGNLDHCSTKQDAVQLLTAFQGGTPCLLDTITNNFYSISTDLPSLANLVSSLCKLAEQALDEWVQHTVAQQLLPALSDVYATTMLAEPQRPLHVAHLELVKLALLWPALADHLSVRVLTVPRLQEVAQCVSRENMGAGPILCLGLMRAAITYNHLAILNAAHLLLNHKDAPVVSTACKAWACLPQLQVSGESIRHLKHIFADNRETPKTILSRCQLNATPSELLPAAAAVQVLQLLRSLLDHQELCEVLLCSRASNSNSCQQALALLDGLLQVMQSYASPAAASISAQDVEVLSHVCGSCLEPVLLHVDRNTAAEHLSSNASVNAVLVQLGRGQPLHPPWLCAHEIPIVWVIILLCKKLLPDKTHKLPASWQVEGSARALARMTLHQDTEGANLLLEPASEQLLELLSQQGGHLESHIREELLTPACVQALLSTDNPRLLKRVSTGWSQEDDQAGGPGTALVRHFLKADCHMAETYEGKLLLEDLLPMLGLLLAVRHTTQQSNPRLDISPSSAAMATTMLLYLGLELLQPDHPKFVRRMLTVTANKQLPSLLLQALQYVCYKVIPQEATLQQWRVSLQGLHCSISLPDFRILGHLRLLYRVICHLEGYSATATLHGVTAEQLISKVQQICNVLGQDKALQ